MLSNPPTLAFSTLFSSLLSFNSFALAATGQGSVSFWSNSDCAQGDTLAFTEPVVIALNDTLDADICSNLPREAHSYLVDKAPICDDGIAAAFAYYGGLNCQEKGFGPALNQLLDSDEIEGECLALVTFASVAFICDGIGEGETPQPATTTSVYSSVSSSIVSVGPAPTVTPIAPSLSTTTPLYTLPSLSTSGPTGTQPSSGIVPYQTGGLPPPSPSPFTGAASGIKAPVLVVLLAFGFRILI